MDLSKYLPNYPEFDGEETQSILGEKENESPYMAISRKNEFYQTKLSRIESKPNVPGKWMNHQVFMSRFLSSHTPYQTMLLMHEPGTGKTCSSVAVIETIRKEHSDITGVLVLMTGESLINNYKNEIVHVCTNGTYLPKHYKKLNKRQKQIQITKSLKKFYEFQTYEKFSSMLQTDWNQDYVKKHYSNKVIILDEVHNLRQHDPNLKQEWDNLNKIKENGTRFTDDQYTLYQLLAVKYNAENPDMVTFSTETLKEINKKAKAKRYTTINDFLHTVTNCKILLLSGTPMRDQPTEIIDIMNLILPLSNKLVENEYFEDSNKLKILKEDKIEDLKNCLKGRVSYLKSMRSDIRKEYITNPNRKVDLGHVSLYGLEMSEFQTNVYRNAQIEDTKSHGMYSKARQANLFAFSDETYGKDGYNGFMGKNSSKLRDIIAKNANGDINIMLSNIQIYSCKYAECIKKIVEHTQMNHFVYSEFVKGSGAFVFGELLRILGFSKTTISIKRELDRQPFIGCDDEDDEDDKGECEEDDKQDDKDDIDRKLDSLGKSKRYAILTADSSPKEITMLNKLFNHDRNMHGEYIQVIIGSSVISEGFTLKNVQHVHILTPDWNFSVTDQVIARSYRLFSHNALLTAYPEKKDISVRIYLYCAFPVRSDYEEDSKDEDLSIDFRMFKTSRDKDISIKAVEHLLKEVSVDCYLNKERNRTIGGKNGERECDYKDCDYQCFGITNPDNIAKNIDYSTYNMYYDENELTDLMNQIHTIFSNVYKIKVQDVLDRLGSFHHTLSILKALYQMITTNYIITDRMGYNCFIRHENDYLYLTHNASRGSFLDQYYVEHFPLQTFQIEEQDRFYLKKMLDDFKKNTKDFDISRFSPQIRELILEQSIDRNDEIIKNIFITNFSVLKDGTVVSILLKPTIRCKPSNQEWQICTHTHEDVQDIQEFDPPQNRYDIVGQMRKEVNKKTGKMEDNLYIYEPSKNNPKNRKTRLRGLKCGTGMGKDGYQKEGLINVFIRLKIPIDEKEKEGTIYTELADPELIKNIFKLKKVDNPIEYITEQYSNLRKKTILNPTFDDRIRYIYWNNKMTGTEMCEELKIWLQKHNILYDEIRKQLL